MWHLFTLTIIGMVSLMTACGDNSQRERERQRAAQEAEELALMRDASRAGPEIERRLRQRIQSNSAIVIINGEYGSLKAIPATTAWTATCGVGLSVSLATAGDDGFSVMISDAFFDDTDCQNLLRVTAAKLIDILGSK